LPCTLFEIGGDLGAMPSSLEARGELTGIELHGGGVPLQVVRRQRLLIGKKEVVILPETPLVTGASRSFRGPTRLTVNRQRKILPHQAEPVPIFVAKSRQYGLELFAIRTFEVGELNELNRRGGETSRRIDVRNGDGLTRRFETNRYLRRLAQLADEPGTRIVEVLLLQIGCRHRLHLSEAHTAWKR
jgi:hypothetical protein